MGQRFSKKRQAIYDCLQGTQTHPSADWIYHHLRSTFPDLSLATVYRNLSQMKRAGMIQSLGVVDGQERFDAIVEPHTHFICTQCDAILDLPRMELPQAMIDRAESDSGCKITGSSLRLMGLCARCRKTLQ